MADFDPTRDAKAIAAGAINAASAQAFGAIVGPVFSADLLDAIGLGPDPSTDYRPYFEKIEKQLDGVRDQLSAVQVALDHIQAEIAGAIALMNAMEKELVQAELDAMLRQFVTRSNLIRENFTSFANAVRALQDKDGARREQAASQLFQIFALGNAQTIAEAMADLQEMIVPALGVERSLADLLLMRFPTALDRLTPAQFIRDTGAGQAAIGAVVEAGCRARLDEEVRDACGIFRAFVTVHIQALVILACAWGDDVQAPQLTDHAGELTAALDRISRFGGALLTGEGTRPTPVAMIRGRVAAFTATVPAIGTGWRIDDQNGGVKHGDVMKQWLVWDFFDGGDGITGTCSATTPPKAGTGYRIVLFNAARPDGGSTAAPDPTWGIANWGTPGEFLMQRVDPPPLAADGYDYAIPDDCRMLTAQG